MTALSLKKGRLCLWNTQIVWIKTEEFWPNENIQVFASQTWVHIGPPGPHSQKVAEQLRKNDARVHTFNHLTRETAETSQKTSEELLQISISSTSSLMKGLGNTDLNL